MNTGLYLMEQETEPKKRMAAYCRVSSDKDEQLHSLNAQRSYYEKALAEDAGCEFAGIYADEGISGTGVKKREGFLRMNGLRILLLMRGLLHRQQRKV